MAPNTMTKPSTAKPKAPKRPKRKSTEADNAARDEAMLLILRGMMTRRPRCVVSYGRKHGFRTAQIIFAGKTRHVTCRSGEVYEDRDGFRYDLTGMSATKPTMTEKSGPSKPRRRRRR